jgi:hypothetical protein
MVDLRREFLDYADGLYAKALQAMQDERFRLAEIYALSSHSPAAFVSADSSGPKDLRDKAALVEEAAWRLAKEAHSAHIWKAMEPSLSGPGHDDEPKDWSAARRGIKSTVLDVFGERD